MAKRFVLLSYLASSDAVFLTIGRRTRPYWQSYVDLIGHNAQRQGDLEETFALMPVDIGMEIKKRVRTRAQRDGGGDNGVIVGGAHANSCRTVFGLSTDSIDPVMAFAMSRDSRSISHASQTAGSSFNSSYRPSRVPAGTSSRPCSSSSSDEIVPSASIVTDSTPLASSTRPLSNVWVSTESASVGSLMRLACCKTRRHCGTGSCGPRRAGRPAGWPCAARRTCLGRFQRDASGRGDSPRGLRGAPMRWPSRAGCRGTGSAAASSIMRSSSSRG